MLLSLLSIFFLKGYNSRTHYTHYTHTPRVLTHARNEIGKQASSTRETRNNAHAYVYLNSTSTHPGETGGKQSGKKSLRTSRTQSTSAQDDPA